MKTIIRTIAILCAVTAVTATAACSKKPAPTESTVSTAVTEAPTVSPTSAPTETPTDPPTDPPTEAPTEAKDQDAADQTILTSGRWFLSEVYVDGEKYQGNYYGSIIAQTGAYLEFNADNSFSCILGYAGCKGTFSVENGDIIARITTVYDGRSAEGNAVDETQTLVWDRDSGTIQLILNDATNYFKQN